MRRARLILGILVCAGLFAAFGCDADANTCGSTADCEDESICLGYGLESTGTCELPCELDADCPSGQTCQDGGNSCTGCDDTVRSCQ